MILQYIHAPYKNIHLLWQPEHPDSIAAQENILRAVNDCVAHEVPILVLHGWQGLYYTFPTDPLDFRFFDRLVAYAKEKNVKIAFENLEGEEYLDALLTRYHNEPNVGYCWDSGHDRCYPHKTDFLQAYGDRLIMTHLNDNFGLRDPSGRPDGKDDLHLLPYDGTIDWDDALIRLKAAPVQEILNFEVKLRSHSTTPADMPYMKLSLEEFVQLAADRAFRIAEKYAHTISQGDET